MPPHVLSAAAYLSDRIEDCSAETLSGSARNPPADYKQDQGGLKIKMSESGLRSTVARWDDRSERMVYEQSEDIIARCVPGTDYCLD